MQITHSIWLKCGSVAVQLLFIPIDGSSKFRDQGRTNHRIIAVLSLPGPDQPLHGSDLAPSSLQGFTLYSYNLLRDRFMSAAA